jgi:hypothetical protein
LEGLEVEVVAARQPDEDLLKEAVGGARHLLARQGRGYNVGTLKKYKNIYEGGQTGEQVGGQFKPEI